MRFAFSSVYVLIEVFKTDKQLRCGCRNKVSRICSEENPLGRLKYARISKNIAAVRGLIEQAPGRSA